MRPSRDELDLDLGGIEVLDTAGLGLRKNTSLSTMPCVNRFAKGSLNSTAPKSCTTRVQKRAYSKCKIACSMPPMY